jgi:hypothetical protein
MSAGEIAAALGKDHSNTRAAARAMARAGLLDERPCTRERNGPGRTAESEFSLGETHVAELERVIAETAEPGTLRSGQQLVFAPSEALAEMSEALGAAGFGARGSWAALCDGEPQECMMVFDGPDAVRAAVDLMGMLRAAEVRCRRVGLTELMPARELASWSQDTAHRARRLRRHRIAD